MFRIAPFQLTLTKIVAARCDFHAQNTPKFVYGRSFATNPTGGVYRLVFGEGKEIKKRGGEEKREKEGRVRGAFLHFYNFTMVSDEREKIAAAMTNVCAI